MAAAAVAHSAEAVVLVAAAVLAEDAWEVEAAAVAPAEDAKPFNNVHS